MKKFSRLAVVALIAVIFIEASQFVLLLLHNNFAILNPKGLVATKERDLLVFAAILAATIVVPVFALTAWIAWKYRSDKQLNNASAETPSAPLQVLWWLVPSLVVLLLAVVTWQGTHDLDPRKPLASAVKPLTIQVVALQWRWLFIYPEQDIATVNFVQFPAGTPVNFNLTADAPMNSFWIPQLGGQMYAMAGMGTQLNLLANQTGEFSGQSAELSGRGFAKMKFIAKASSEEAFDTWTQMVKQSANTLDESEYDKVASPSEDSQVVFYSLSENNLYNKIITKFIGPDANHVHSHTSEAY